MFIFFIGAARMLKPLLNLEFHFLRCYFERHAKIMYSNQMIHKPGEKSKFETKTNSNILDAPFWPLHTHSDDIISFLIIILCKIVGMLIFTLSNVPLNSNGVFCVCFFFPFFFISETTFASNMHLPTHLDTRLADYRSIIN